MSPAASGRQDRIRVVYLIGQLGLGGSERQLQVLLQHFDRELYECSVIVFNASRHGELHSDLEALGIPVLDLPRDCRGILRRVLFLYRTVRRLRPDVLHSWTAYVNPYAGIVGRLAGVPARLGSLRSTTRSKLMRSLPKAYRWLVLHGVDGLVVNTQKCVDELRQLGVPGRRVWLLPNCVPLPAGEPSAEEDEVPVDLRELGIDASHRLVGLVGNLREVKNHLFFVDAMARVLPEFPEARVLLVGQALPSEPELAGRIEARIDRHGLRDRFALTGFRADVPRLMRRMEICCLTSKREGMPNVLLEAMAAARPVVATRVGGVPELVRDGDNGFLVDSGDIEGFARAVSRLLREPQLARRLGARGRERVERRHRCREAAGRLAVFYRQALPDLSTPQPIEDSRLASHR